MIELSCHVLAADSSERGPNLSLTNQRGIYPITVMPAFSNTQDMKTRFENMSNTDAEDRDFLRQRNAINFKDKVKLVVAKDQLKGIMKDFRFLPTKYVLAALVTIMAPIRQFDDDSKYSEKQLKACKLPFQKSPKGFSHTL